MKNLIITLLLIILLSILNYAQNTYNVKPGVKNNQIVLELKNISETEQISLTKPLQRRGLKHIIFSDNIEETIVLNPSETKEVVYRFDVDYNIGNAEADTIEFLITDNKSIYLTKQFILQYTLPTEYKLEQNYPNPFNPNTKIRYSLPQEARGEKQEVSLIVYDILGNKVTTLVNEQKEAGYYETKFNASQYASGVYIYRLQAGSFVSTKKMLLIK
ncbi:T9SS type A sorting domain-containing protein [Ignavibacterium sp.]|uniref:T9SS type A sorting domain-containing protein n=1 Tax=Ignavibacterium sp. TaxID=2651167 RepID=UPI00307F7D38